MILYELPTTGKQNVLCLHFKKPNGADDAQMTDDNIIIRNKGKEMVGMMILNAGKRTAPID